MSTEAVEQLPRLIGQCPYCATYRLMYCIALANTHSTGLNDALQQAACALPDRTQLFMLVNNGEHVWIELLHQLEKQRRDSHQSDTADDDFALIDQFLSQQLLPGLDPDSPLPAATCGYEPEDLANVTAAIDGEEDIVSANANDDDEQDSIIDRFLTADENGELLVPKATVAIEDAPTPDPELIREKAFLTESLAKLYVKQHKFEQALSIFSQLNLQYSKKSGNFADQIRYLEKVIALQKERMATSGSKKIQ